MERLGILGGTFDPPHDGHLALARAARRALRLAGVWWVLTPDPPHKDRSDLSPYGVRREMLLAAIAGEPVYSLCEVENERPGPQFMVDTIAILRERYPRSDFYLLVGEDSLRDLPLWHRPLDLIAECPLAVLGRPGVPADLDALEMRVPGVRARTTLLNAAEVDISSTAIRERVARGEPIRGLLPAAVEEIIRNRGLYRREG